MILGTVDFGCTWWILSTFSLSSLNRHWNSALSDLLLWLWFMFSVANVCSRMICTFYIQIGTWPGVRIKYEVTYTWGTLRDLLSLVLIYYQLSSCTCICVELANRKSGVVKLLMFLHFARGVWLIHNTLIVCCIVLGRFILFVGLKVS